ncbi:MAG: MerR family transcriptional regulator [gamma proteobacterium endosymbiont of Lamellibrachia anaximandri]|nr:MerR family transcriptional regulator [gamma proteobacterium endosymbiont of Lamellibrachia anaximandri]MBL3535721.1 MerR family transcriptional regulator [gamma proteobacterium endosymbiont of Lamellibrachia anaximandri]
MTYHEQPPALTGELLQDYCLTLQQLCHSAATEPEFALELVEYEVLEPQGQRAINWRFQAGDLARLQRAQRLMHDFELNLSGLALVMRLLDEVAELRG